MANQDHSGQCVVAYIDDSANDQFFFSHAVSRAQVPLRVLPFLSHEPAVNYLRGERPFDDRNLHPFPELLVCDYHLRPAKGSEVLVTIRAIPACETLPAIVFSGFGDRLTVIECYAAGANCFLVKPSAMERWEKLVRALHTCATSNPKNFEHLHTLEECRLRHM